MASNAICTNLKELPLYPCICGVHVSKIIRDAYDKIYHAIK